MIDVSQVRFDEKGLVPAIVQDEKTGKVLMVAWMNAESLERTMTTGLATFWSRSRQELWLKGATSGHYMHVREVRIDCDGDTLLVLVEPEGAACHTGAESCFFRSLEPCSADLIATGDATADYHIHTVFSDGAHTPEAMAEAALAAGLATLGFADHSYVVFDDDYCMKPSTYGEYQAAIGALNSQYEGRLQVLCGIEQDYFSPWQGEGFDYVIGSVHYLRVPGKNAGTLVTEDNLEGEFLPLDISPEILRLGIDKYFGGDAYALAEAYYGLVADVVRTTGCSIIGHFDLVKIFNGITEEREPDKRFFDERHPRYIAAWQKAADVLLACGVSFEINVNGVARGRCAEPYPSKAIVKYLAERGARFVYSSDAHGTSFLKRHDERSELAFLGSLN